MSIITEVQEKMDAVRVPLALDIVRIALGIFILIKGYQFTMDFENTVQSVGSLGMALLASPIAHYISLAHIIGGATIAMGAYTRPMCALNIPILIGAVFFNARIFSERQDTMEITTAILVLFLLCLFFYIGSGKLSLEQLQRNRETGKSG